MRYYSVLGEVYISKSDLLHYLNGADILVLKTEMDDEKGKKVIKIISDIIGLIKDGIDKVGG